MELHPKRRGETHIALFRRIEREEKVHQYFLYWPFGAHGAGANVEVGALLDRRARGDSLDVHVLLETSAGEVSRTELTLSEGAKGTRYFHDLLAYGANVVRWETHRGLFRAARSHVKPPI